MRGHCRRHDPQRLVIGQPALDMLDPFLLLEGRFRAWTELQRDFRREGFYERFPARGQVERVDKIRRRLSSEAGLLRKEG